VSDLLARSDTVGIQASVLSQPRVANYPERGARLARREERAYREYVSDEQRSQAGCPARRIVKSWLGQDTRGQCVFRKPNDGRKTLSVRNPFLQSYARGTLVVLLISSGPAGSGPMGLVHQEDTNAVVAFSRSF